MPIAPRFFIEHIESLALQIKRAPEAVRVSQIKTTEQLLLELEEETIYPLDYVIFRITKYRIDKNTQPMLLGSALIGDLVALVAVVSRTLSLSSKNMLTVKEAAIELEISCRTLSRLRREGFVFYWVVEQDGRRRLGCEIEQLNSFRNRHKYRLEKASAFSRLSHKEQQSIVASALEYSGSGRSLNDIATELSRSSTRGHETIRTILQKVTKTREVFQKAPPLSREESREIERALRSGETWKSLSSRFDRSVGGLRRSLARLRASELKKLKLTHVELDVFLRGDAEEVILGSPAATHTEPLVLKLDPLTLEQLQNERENTEETAVVSAMHLLRRRAITQISCLRYSPSESVLDRIETDLRWSFLLQQQLMIVAMPASVAVAVQHARRPLDELPSNTVLSLVKQVIHVVGEACGALNPTTGQTAERTPASVLDRALSTVDMDQLLGRAAARQKTPILLCPFHGVVSWSSLLPKLHLPAIALETSVELAELVSLRFGWSGKPRTFEEIAIELGCSTNWVSRRLRTIA